MSATARGAKAPAPVSLQPQALQDILRLGFAQHRSSQLEVLFQGAVRERRVRVADAGGLQPLLAPAPSPRWRRARRASRGRRLRVRDQREARCDPSAPWLCGRQRRSGSKAASRTEPCEQCRHYVFERVCGLRPVCLVLVVRDFESGAVGRHHPVDVGGLHIAVRRRLTSSAPSIAAKVWLQHAWFLNVMRVMWKSRPSAASQRPGRGCRPWRRRIQPSRRASQRRLRAP